MSHSTIERALDHAQVNQLLDHPLNGARRDAVLLLNRLVGFVERLAVACEAVHLGKKSLLADGQSLVQPYLGRYPHAFEVSFHWLKVIVHSVLSRNRPRLQSQIVVAVGVD